MTDSWDYTVLYTMQPMGSVTECELPVQVWTIYLQAVDETDAINRGYRAFRAFSGPKQSTIEWDHAERRTEC